LDSVTATATSWDPGPDDYVQAIAVGGNTIYAGGWFARMQGWPRKSLAAIDAATGQTREWDASGDGVVDAIAVMDGTIYAGGLFRSLGGQSRRDLAAIDAQTGLATIWSPTLGPGAGGDYSDVRALQLLDGVLYVGGFFGSMNGTIRNYLGALNAATGDVLTDWDPNPDGAIWAIASGPQRVYAAGGYERMKEMPVGSIASLSAASAPRPRIAPGTVLVSPNPVVPSSTLSFALIRPGLASLAVYDIQGRRVATLLHDSPMSAGEHTVALGADSWAAGCYVAKLEVDGRTSTRKLVVVR